MATKNGKASTASNNGGAASKLDLLNTNEIVNVLNQHGVSVGAQTVRELVKQGRAIDSAAINADNERYITNEDGAHMFRLAVQPLDLGYGLGTVDTIDPNSALEYAKLYTSGALVGRSSNMQAYTIWLPKDHSADDLLAIFEDRGIKCKMRAASKKTSDNDDNDDDDE